MRLTLLKLTMLGMVCGFTGCTCIEDHKDQCFTSMYNTWDAKRASWRHRKCWKGDSCRGDVRSGFEAGYIDAMNGCGCCPPLLPPRKYWSVHNRHDVGAERTRSWYDGYVMGSTQALSDGAANSQRIVTASELYGWNLCPQPGAAPTHQLNWDEICPPEAEMDGDLPPPLPLPEASMDGDDFLHVVPPAK